MAGLAFDLPIQRLDPDLPLPSYANAGDAGLDVYARESVTIAPHRRYLMPTGIAIAIPHGWVGLMHPRSGWAIKAGLTHANSPGTIDAGYRGEIRVPLLNTDATAPIVIERGDRIGQLVFQEVARANLVVVDTLPDGNRNDQGFGSSGR